ncbi:hypothetical protein EKH77_03355 [Streptomyces luteoverticillatus]|uniref:Uncharacterized protein n=1 Tax=Streptomyces luteoverticillatus TaxID=66425 RepID=A0A3Q9FRF9_STRLT|nr:hypothetical protein [Streptomyces luteoverticillatus]AZQ70379.1 hypothetical protein EKH77_03355 [Streptomyces luteoverticillatus]
MHSPSFPLSVWWVVSAVATVIYLAFYARLIPDRGITVRLCAVPAWMVPFAAVLILVRWLDAQEALACYSATLLGIVLAFAGRGRTIRQAYLDGAGRPGVDPPKPTPGMYAQLFCACTGVIALTVWLCA